MATEDKVAGIGVVGTWGAWGASHIAEINQWVQLVLLIAGLISAFYTIRHYRSRERALIYSFTGSNAFPSFKHTDTE